MGSVPCDTAKDELLATTKFPVRFVVVDCILSPTSPSSRSLRLRRLPNDPLEGCDLLKSCHVAAAQNFEWVLLSFSTSVEREERKETWTTTLLLSWLLAAPSQLIHGAV